MFRFEHPDLFWSIIITILLVVIFYVRRYYLHKDLARWGSASTVKRIASRLAEKPYFLWMSLTAFLFINISLVNPQWGFKTRSVEGKTADFYILFDISTSMLAEDIAPNRLERARRFTLDLASEFKSDRIGLILFAGNAYMQSPLTSDWRAIQLYLNAAHPDQAGTQGTAIGEAVQLAMNTQEQEEEGGQGALIIITDGEDHESDAVSIVQDALSRGWITYVVGVGTEAGATIPVMEDGNKVLKRDASGQPVRTTMNSELMTNLAQQGNGKYFDILEGNTAIEKLKSELNRLERTQQEKRSFSEHKSYYQWFLMGAIVLLLLMVTIRYKYDVV